MPPIRRRLTALKEGGRSGSDGPGRHRTRDALVVGQIALALTLLVVSGLMIRTFIAMRQVDPGFARPEEVQTFVLAIPESLIGDPQQAVRTFEGVAEQLARVPASPPLVSRLPSRWTAKTTATTPRLRNSPTRKGRRSSSDGSRASAPGISRRWATGWSRAIDHMERHPRAAAGRRHFRAPRARALGRAGEGDRQAPSRQFVAISVARNHRRVR